MIILDVYNLLHADSYILVDFYTYEEVDCVTKEQLAAVYGYAKVKQISPISDTQLKIQVDLQHYYFVESLLSNDLYSEGIWH